MAEFTSVFLPLFSSYLFYEVARSQVWSYLTLSVKGDGQKKRKEIFEMEYVFIKYGVCFPAVRKGDNNFHLMCNLYAKVWSNNICKENSCWNKVTNNFLRAEKKLFTSPKMSVLALFLWIQKCYQQNIWNAIRV